MHSDPLYWLKNLVISCREDDDKDDQNDESDDADDDGEEDEDESQNSGTDNEGDEDDEFKDDQGKIDWEAKAKAQEEALKKERRFRRKAERENRQLKKKSKTKPAGRADEVDDDEDDDKGKSKTDPKLVRKLDRVEARNQKLAEGLLARDLNAAIARVADKMGFIDPSDAQTEAIRKEIDYEQDRDDPTDIEIDMDSVEEAVQELADDKPHLVDKDKKKSKVKSGSKMRRKGGDDETKVTEQKLLNDYPSLRS